MEAVELLYQPMVLENALNCVFNQYRQDHDEPLATPMDALPSLLQIFQCFVNKLSLVCDNERGGRTVTAIAILQGKDCAVYVLASNCRTLLEQREVEVFFNQNSSLGSSEPTPTGAESINQEGPLAHDTVQH